MYMYTYTYDNVCRCTSVRLLAVVEELEHVRLHRLDNNHHNNNNNNNSSNRSNNSSNTNCNNNDINRNPAGRWCRGCSAARRPGREVLM